MNEMLNTNLKISNNRTELDKIPIWIEEISDKIALDFKMSFNIQLCLDELLTNIINYGYPDKRAGNIHIQINIQDKILKLTVKDDADEFNPLDAPEPDLNENLEDRKIGGLGVFLIKKISQKQLYIRENGFNIFVMEFEL